MAFSRRDFLKKTCCATAAGFAAASFNRFGLVNALAQSSQDYKALVFVLAVRCLEALVLRSVATAASVLSSK